jgi:hypothetical protein
MASTPKVSTSAGSTFAISVAAPATFDAAGYVALTFTNVAEITDIGEFGKVYNVVKHLPLATRREQKFKGSYQTGSVVLKMARLSSDAGQLMLKTALDSDSNVSVCITLQDGEKLYFAGTVIDFKNGVGGADKITERSVTIEVNTDVIEV